MKKIRFILFPLFFVCFSPVLGKAQLKITDGDYMKNCVKTLASDSMGGRAPGTKYDQMAADFIAGEFGKLKIKPLRTSGYFQDFSYTKDTAVIHTRNVAAILDNKAQKSIIIGAHYDHLGFGGARSRSYGKHEVHNGADDNASGVALMLAMARQIKQSRFTNYNFIFISFSGHEDGLLGSGYFAKSMSIADSNISLMINMDMVGRADTLNPFVFIGGSDTAYISRLKSVGSQQALIKTGDKELPEGDHSAFASRNIPVLFITTGMEDDYHRVSDDESLINYKALVAIEKLIMGFLKKLNLKR
jgi:Zn-dependent M28 family amino/carboxypeptidase